MVINMHLYIHKIIFVSPKSKCCKQESSYGLEIRHINLKCSLISITYKQGVLDINKIIFTDILFKYKV